ncbi:TlpA family protein disulfide reductase [Amycolatopsis pigmentata]|uniref:TlpA family protein disulfide reductase n=1 Tax=Amycolatopsis pigmentata TaxID=450801 RepID=A0ABW5FV54_9PSEU
MNLVLTTAVILVGLLCAFDLLLTLGVIKRLREHTELLSAAESAPPAPIAVGSEVEDFHVTTVDGESLRADMFDGETLVAFFSPSCGPCQERLPKFVEYAGARPGGRDRALAIVIGDEAQTAAPVAALSPVARVVVEDPDGALANAFEVNAYPTVLMITPNEAGRIVVTDNQVRFDQPLAAV